MTNIYDSLKNKSFEDPNINCAIAARADTSDDKIDLSLGTLCDKDGKFYMFESVKKAEQLVINDDNRTEDYLFMSGDEEFCLAARSILFPGAQSEELSQLVSLQTFGSTGAIALFLQLFSELDYNPTVYLSDPTWCNYYGMLENVGLKYTHHPYIIKGENRLDIDSMISCLSKANLFDILILQVCSHNPSGLDLSEEDWAKVLEVVQQRKLIVLLDIPYQGLSKDFITDVYPCMLFLKARPAVELFVAQSFSKIMGLCSGRIGCLHFRTLSNSNHLKIALTRIIRATYSTPPRHYASLVKRVLTTPDLKKEWLEELTMLANGLKKARAELCNKMVNEFGDRWSFVAKQSGMYAYLNIEDELVKKMRDMHIYTSFRGRIVLSRINERNIDRLIYSLKSCLGIEMI